MNVAGFALVASGIALVVCSAALGILFEQRPELERYGTRFTRDAALFATRIIGGMLILLGSVLSIAIHSRR